MSPTPLSGQLESSLLPATVVGGRKRVRVALISGVYPPRIGGPATQTRQLARLLRDGGDDPFVVTFGGVGVADDDVRVHRLPERAGGAGAKLRQYADAISALRRILRTERPDVLHVQTLGPFAASVALLNRRLRIPSLVKYAGDMVWEIMMRDADPESLLAYDQVFGSSAKARLLTLVQRSVLSGFTRVWATTRYQADSLVRHLRIDPRRILLEPNYVEIEPAPSAARRPSGAPVVVLAASRFTPWKRVDLVLRAFALAGRRDSILWIAGGEHEGVERELKRLASELELGDRVCFLGSVPPSEMGALFRRADVFVSATDYEPFGIAFVEAMAAGLPVVATAVGGIPEVVPDGVAGFLVPQGDAVAISQRLGVLIDDAELRERFGRAGAAHARRYDIRKNLHRFRTMYEAVLQGAGATN